MPALFSVLNSSTGTPTSHNTCFGNRNTWSYGSGVIIMTIALHLPACDKRSKRCNSRLENGNYCVITQYHTRTNGFAGLARLVVTSILGVCIVRLVLPTTVTTICTCLPVIDSVWPNHQVKSQQTTSHGNQPTRRYPAQFTACKRTVSCCRYAYSQQWSCCCCGWMFGWYPQQSPWWPEQTDQPTKRRYDVVESLNFKVHQRLVINAFIHWTLSHWYLFWFVLCKSLISPLFIAVPQELLDAARDLGLEGLAFNGKYLGDFDNYHNLHKAVALSWQSQHWHPEPLKVYHNTQVTKICQHRFNKS